MWIKKPAICFQDEVCASATSRPVEFILGPARLDDTETLLKVAGTRGTFRLDLMGAKIDGQPGTLLANRKRLRDAWYGVRLGGRWISGPHDTPKSSYA
jgi:hypothetical protein